MDKIDISFGVVDNEGNCVGKISIGPQTDELTEGLVRIENNMLQYWNGSTWADLRQIINVDAPIVYCPGTPGEYNNKLSETRFNNAMTVIKG